MWHLRCLTGPMAGKILPLKLGRNTIGRAPHCDVTIPSQNISKEHAVIEVYNDKIIVSDLGSRNGTFVNGVQVKSQKIKLGERISFFDIIVEVIKKSPRQEQSKQIPPQLTMPTPNYNGNLAYDQFAHGAAEQAQPQAIAAAPQESNLLGYFKKYVDEVVMPGVYKLLEWFEFRTVIGLFVIGFVILVTVLSTIPLTRILKSSVEQEAQNRSLTIAKLLVRDNQMALAQGQTSLVTVENAMNEPGVTQAYVLSNVNGDILAPPNLVGQYITTIPFVHDARKWTVPQVKQIDDSTIVAVAPVLFNNPNTGQLSASAHSVVVYNMGALAVDNQRTISLFIQVLVLALFFGFILYFFLYKLIEQPLIDLNEKINSSKNHGQLNTQYQFPELQKLAANITSAISRGGGGFAGDQLNPVEADRSQEMQNIASLVGFPAMAIMINNKSIATVNTHFDTQLGNGQSWVGLTLDKILDQALKLNLQSLTDRVIANPNVIIQDQLEISNQAYDLSAQGVMGTQGLSYILVVFIPKFGGGS